MWAKICVRTLAVVNVGFVLRGAYDIQVALSGFPILQNSLASHGVTRQFPYQQQIFHTMTAVCGLFLIGLLVSSYYLWRVSVLGRVISNVVFVTEIVYWLLSIYAVQFALRAAIWTTSLLLSTVGVVGYLGNFGLAGQFQFWYPVLALIALNVSFHRLAAEKAG